MLIPPLVPPGLISGLAFLAGILCIAGTVKIPKMTRSSLVMMFRLGMIFLAGGLFMYAIIYFIFTENNIDIDIRTRWVRFTLTYLFSIISIWQTTLLIKGDTL